MLPDLVLDLFARQYGVAASTQLTALPPSQRRTVNRHPDIERISPRVIRHRATPPIAEQGLLAAVLDAGPDASLWSKSAADFWGFDRHRCDRPHVGRPRTRLRGERLGQVHLLGEIDARDVTTHRGIPVSRPETTILWMAGALTHRFDEEVAARRIGVVLDHAWRQRLIDGAFIHELADRSGGRGRSGIVALRHALEHRPPDYRPAGSRLEERFEELLPWTVSSCLQRQVPVHVDEQTMTVDFGLEAWPLLVEINGEAWHSSVSDRAADEQRYRRLLSAGYSVVVFWEFDIWHQAGLVRDVMLHLARTPDPAPTLHRPTAPPWPDEPFL